MISGGVFIWENLYNDLYADASNAPLVAQLISSLLSNFKYCLEIESNECPFLFLYWSPGSLSDCCEGGIVYGFTETG